MKLIEWLKNLFRPTRRLGLIPQEEDPRDYKYQPVGIIDDEVDLFIDDLPITNQGSYNSCVGHSAAYVLSRLLDDVLPEGDYYDRHALVSAAFIWVMAKQDEGTIGKNVGVVARNAFGVMHKYGFINKYSFDFGDGIYKLPSLKILELANVYRLLLNYIPGYYGINRNLTKKMQYMKDALSDGYPISLAIPVHENFQKYRGGILSENTGNFLGYHDVVIGGYYVDSEGKTIYKGRNSWGTSWGEKGYFRITEAHLRAGSFDIWTVK